MQGVLWSVWNTRQSLEPSFQNEPNHSLAETAETHTMDHTANMNCSVPCVALREETSEVYQEADIKNVHESQSGLNDMSAIIQFNNENLYTT